MHSNAWKLRHSRFYLPVHKGFAVDKVLKILGYCQENKNSEIEINSRLVTDRKEWEEFINGIDNPNLLQTWCYGAVKERQKLWSVKRIVFLNTAGPIAIVQIVYVDIKILKLNRINRGPLFFPGTSSELQTAVMKKLGKQFSLTKWQMLFISPEMRLSGSALSLLKCLGYKKQGNAGWESILIDLRQDIHFLRNNLDAKWRNMLNFSEKANLVLVCSNHMEDFRWMMRMHQDNMITKKYNGPRVPFLESVRSLQNGNEQFIVLTAYHDNEKVAGICIAPHGKSATYLIGWNGNKGRDLKANNFLLWNAVVYLKENHFNWFDLGGISEEFTPSITRFKIGMNGERYENAAAHVII